MRSVVSPTQDGLVLHEGPTLNANNLGTVPWGESVTVSNRMAFAQALFSGDQVWYRAVYGGQTGWIAARIEDKYYVSGTDASNDPCAGVVGPVSSLTFTYDRNAAAEYAIPHSYQNVSWPGGLRVTRRLTGVPFANFNYADLAGGTGSAVFISEAIWMGGLPMTVGDPNSCLIIDPATAVAPGSGWRYCWVETSGNTGPSWDHHKSLITYYTNGTAPIPSANLPNSILADKGEQLMFTGLADKKGNSISALDVNGYFNYLSVGVVGDKDGLSEFARTHLGQLQKGDYMWINSYSSAVAGSDVHGFLIVGWGEPMDCSDALSTNFTAASFADTIPPDPTLAVPYVVDFVVVQKPIPRPFYCSRFQEPGRPNFVPHEWFFYTLPDQISIPDSELYTDPLWQWEASDG
ncbi:MAG: SH3 domain-containing protein [Chloroflexi bacterium]|nr:SH3 domain-containing protein [Chloroflexota bacterium]